MAARKAETFEPVTLGHIRSHGCRDLLSRQVNRSRTCCTTFHCRGTTSSVLRGGSLLNFVGLVETDELSEESWTSKFPWEHLKRDFTGWHPDIQTIIDKADKNNCFRWSLYYRPAIENWSSQHVTMLGDAVHATLPYLAQGAAM